MSISRTVLAAAVIAALTACGSSGDDPVNLAPVANAGGVQSVIAGATVVTLDGSRSADPNGDALRYTWTLTGKPAGSTAALSDPTSPKPTFVADVPGSYVASLVVNDGSLASPASTVTVTAAMGNVAPVANAGGAQNVLTGATVTLDGSASGDANSDALTYAWTLTTRPAASAAALSGATSARPTFIPDVAGTYVASLTVSDGSLTSAIATVSITAAVANVVPMANAGSAQNVVAGAMVTLDGSASSDANNDALTYAWTLTSRPGGSAATLAGATSAKPTFVADVAGVYVATLTVNDGKVASAPATVSITAAVANVAPIANAGAAQNVVAGGIVTLDGSASTDANMDALTYAWTLTGRPAGSSAALTGANAAKPTFVADVAGVYVASLVVNDGKVASAPATVTVTAAVANVAPVANAGTAQNVNTGNTVTLDGSASSDANMDPLSYAWTLTGKPVGSTATLAGATLAKPTFVADLAGTYVGTLVVNDGKVGSAPATVAITATVANAAPVAIAGPAQSVIAGATVNLNGSGSSDANSDPLTYAWTLTAKPSNSAAALSNATSVNPGFVADLVGNYVATLVVNDGKVSSAPSTVAITADTVVGFDSMTPMPPNMPSLGFEATRTVSLGDRFVLAAGAPRTVRSVVVATSSWACQSGGASTSDCVSAPGATFTHPITLRILDASGNLLKSVTQTFTLPYRPSADPTCVDSDAGKWKASNGFCYNGYASAITFDLLPQNIQLPSDTFAIELSYNTRTYGAAPLGVSGPYDSLNIGLFSTTPSVGADAEPGVVLWNGNPEIFDEYSVMAKVIVGAP